MKREEETVMDINAPVTRFTLQDQTKYASSLTMIPKFHKSQSISQRIPNFWEISFCSIDPVSVNWLVYQVYQDKPLEALLEKEGSSKLL